MSSTSTPKRRPAPLDTRLSSPRSSRGSTPRSPDNGAVSPNSANAGSPSTGGRSSLPGRKSGSPSSRPAFRPRGRELQLFNKPVGGSTPRSLQASISKAQQQNGRDSNLGSDSGNLSPATARQNMSGTETGGRSNFSEATYSSGGGFDTMDSMEKMRGERRQSLTLGESERRIAELERSEFDLKMRLHYLEERLKATVHGDDNLQNHFDIIDLRQRLESRDIELAQAHSECRQLQQLVNDLKSQLHRLQEEANTAVEDREHITSSTEVRYQQEISLLESLVRQERADNEATKQHCREAMEGMEAELLRQRERGREGMEASDRARIMIRTSENREQTLEAMSMNIASLKVELERVGTANLVKDLELQKLRLVRSQNKIMAEALEGKDAQIAALQADAGSLRQTVASHKSALIAAAREMQQLQTSAETVARLEAEEILRQEEALMAASQAAMDADKERRRLEAVLASTTADLVEARQTMAREIAAGKEKELKRQTEDGRLLRAAAIAASKCEKLSTELSQACRDKEHAAAALLQRIQWEANSRNETQLDGLTQPSEDVSPYLFAATTPNRWASSSTPGGTNLGGRTSTSSILSPPTMRRTSLKTPTQTPASLKFGGMNGSVGHSHILSRDSPDVGPFSSMQSQSQRSPAPPIFTKSSLAIRSAIDAELSRGLFVKNSPRRNSTGEVLRDNNSRIQSKSPNTVGSISTAATSPAAIKYDVKKFEQQPNSLGRGLTVDTGVRRTSESTPSSRFNGLQAPAAEGLNTHSLSKSSGFRDSFTQWDKSWNSMKQESSVELDNQFRAYIDTNRPTSAANSLGVNS